MPLRFVSNLSTAIAVATWVTLAPYTYAQTQPNSVPVQPTGTAPGNPPQVQNSGGYPQSQFGVYPQQPGTQPNGGYPQTSGVQPSGYPQSNPQTSGVQPGGYPQPNPQQPAAPGYPQQPNVQPNVQPAVGSPAANPNPVAYPAASPRQPLAYPPPAPSAPVIAQPQPPSFYCGQSQGYPATVARTPRGDVTVIQWVSDFFSASGWTPETRCQEVSRRFQTFSRAGVLQFVTTGYINRQPVICAAQERYGRCTGLLLTLKPGSNPTATLQRLMNASAYGSAPLHESTEEALYINMRDFLRQAPINP